MQRNGGRRRHMRRSDRRWRGSSTRRRRRSRARGVSGAGDLGEGLEEGAPADLQTMESLDDPVVPLLEAAKRLRHAQHEAMGAREVLLSQQLKELRGATASCWRTGSSARRRRRRRWRPTATR